jgi:hypothetical protein
MATTPTVLTLSGRPVSFLPVPTPWPSSSGCASYIYEQCDGDFLGWDPWISTAIPSASSCFPPELVAWWFQPLEAATYTQLGPTFACPEAYATVATSVLDVGTTQVFCCPS